MMKWDEHQWGWAAASHEEQREKSRRLWSLLDVAGDDREDG